MGYPLNIFISGLIDEDVCAICHLVIQEARLLVGCGHTFCKDCVETSLFTMGRNAIYSTSSDSVLDPKDSSIITPSSPSSCTKRTKSTNSPTSVSQFSLSHCPLCWKCVSGDTSPNMYAIENLCQKFVRCPEFYNAENMCTENRRDTAHSFPYNRRNTPMDHSPMISSVKSDLTSLITEFQPLEVAVQSKDEPREKEETNPKHYKSGILSIDLSCVQDALLDYGNRGTTLSQAAIVDDDTREPLSEQESSVSGFLVKRSYVCQWIGKLKDLEMHVNKCEFKVVTCPLNGCAFRCKRMYLKEHMDVCSAMYKVIACPVNGCTFKCERIFLMEHMDACSTKHRNLKREKRDQIHDILKQVEIMDRRAYKKE